MNVLVVEDDASVARFLGQALDEAGHRATVVRDGPSALSAIPSADWALILLDVMLPGFDGFTVCRRMRSAGIAAPILMLTARDTLEDKVQGLDSGADDYIVKPFQLAELMARVRALLRRGAVPLVGQPLLTVGDLMLDAAAREAHRGDKTVSLSATEYALLEYLMRNAGRVVSRSQILEHVWHYDFNGQDNVLDVYISYLRAKIDRGFATPLIHTVRGVGYRLSPPSPADASAAA
jgi:DNA-binding response OmpR family regulator